jgi:DNA-directed RNA polymerase subunit M/transcription elongation factor TFIIS
MLSKFGARRPNVVQTKAPPTPKQLRAEIKVIPSAETVASILGKVEIEREGKTYRLSSTQIEQLTSLSYPDGTLVLTLGNRSLIYELTAASVQFGFDKMIPFYTALAEGPNRSETAFVLDSPVFEKEKNQHLADMDRQRRATSVMAGSDPCPKCKGMTTISQQVQMRSADEPMTTLIYCFDCVKKFRLS